jgi:hypothetical protein
MKKSLLFGAFAIVASAAFAQDNISPAGQQYLFTSSTVPLSGTNEVQTFTISALAAAKIQFTYKGYSQTLSLSGTEASNAVISSEATTALGAIPSIGGTAQVSVSTTGTGARAIAVTFQGRLANLDVPMMTTSVTSGTITCTGTTTTAGITATGRLAPTGALLLDLGDARLYINRGSAPSPTWTLVSPN